MAKHKWRHAYNYQSLPSGKETITGESMTVPDEAMSIQQIFANYSRGLPIPTSPNINRATYNEEYFPDEKTLDLVDKQELSEQNLETFENYKKQETWKRNKKKYDKWKETVSRETQDPSKSTGDSTGITLEVPK